MQEEVQKIWNEAVAEAFTRRVVAALTAKLDEKWSQVVDELVTHRKRNKELAEAISKLETKVNKTSERVEEIHSQTRETVKLQKKAKKLLDEALKDLNIEE